MDRRRDRLVKTIDAALDIDNYNPLPEVTEEKKYELTMPGTVHIFLSVLIRFDPIRFDPIRIRITGLKTDMVHEIFGFICNIFLICASK